MLYLALTLKVCWNYENPNCSLFEKYFPDLKLGHLIKQPLSHIF